MDRKMADCRVRERHRCSLTIIGERRRWPPPRSTRRGARARGHLGLRERAPSDALEPEVAKAIRSVTGAPRCGRPLPRPAAERNREAAFRHGGPEAHTFRQRALPRRPAAQRRADRIRDERGGRGQGDGRLLADAKLAVEVDSYATHGDSATYEDDHILDADFEAAGIKVLRFTGAAEPGRRGSRPHCRLAGAAPWRPTRPAPPPPGSARTARAPARSTRPSSRVVLGVQRPRVQAHGHRVRVVLVVVGPVRRVRRRNLGVELDPPRGRVGQPEGLEAVRAARQRHSVPAGGAAT